MKIVRYEIIKSEERLENWMFLCIFLDNGMKGFGEISSAPKNADAVAAIAERTLERLLGENPLEDICPDLNPDSIVFTTVESGIDQALYDLRSQLADMPLYEYLGGKEENIRVYANINRALRKNRDTAVMCKHFADAASAGFIKTKISPFDNLLPSSDENETEKEIKIAITRIKSAVEIFGNRNVSVDCHQRFSREAADLFFSRLKEEAIELEYIEDVFFYEKEFRPIQETLIQKYNLRLAGGELCISKDEIKELVDCGCFSIYNPDIKFLGRTEDYISALRYVKDNGYECAPHNPTSPISTAFSAAIVSAFCPGTILEFAFGCQGFRNELIGKEEAIDGRFYRLSGNPGLGISISQDFLRKYCYRYEKGTWTSYESNTQWN